MKSLKNILLLSTVLAGLFFLVGQNQPVRIAVPSENPTSEYSHEGMRVAAFIQPETAQHVVSTAKSFPFFVAKLSDFFETDFTNILTSKLRNNLLSQDINRCESVSLLLFPHHYFW